VNRKSSIGCSNAGYESALRVFLRAMLAFATLCLFPAIGQAQAVNQYIDTISGAIADQTCGTAGVVTRTFNVAASYTVSDVNLGIFLSHTYRSDLRITLAHGGTTVNVMTNAGGSGDNLNDLFDDEATTAIAGHSTTTTDSTTAPPPYAHSYQPSTALNAFDGQNANGIWTMTICDSAIGDTGTYTRADLYITQAPTSYADLSLAKTVSNTAPASGSAISYTLSLNNSAASTLTANAVTVQDTLPPGVTFVSATGFGSYNSANGVWSVGAIPPNTTRTLTINVTVAASAGATVLNSAEITASSAIDIDSTPGNNSTLEDDDDSVSFTVSGTRVAGTAPMLVCPVGSTVFDWDAVAWTAGSLNNNYALANIGTINFALSSTAIYRSNATFGGQTPIRTTGVSGGLLPAQFSLVQDLDFSTQSETSSTVVTLPTAVPALQFNLFDIDFNAGQFADRVRITGSFNGSAVIPTLTNGLSNYVVGNQAFGDVAAGDTTANGTVTVTFGSPVDTVTIEYGNSNAAPANPGGQWMGIHDFTFCNPQATLSVSKISSVITDGLSTTNPKSIPGATVQYCITVANAGSGTTAAVSAVDTLPGNVTFVSGSMRTGGTCGTASTVEDDDSAGADETDPYGMSIAGSTMTGTAVSLAPGASFAMTLLATIN
jgi:uncharacterized repeat protein (TIGR01451 family)